MPNTHGEVDECVILDSASRAVYRRRLVVIEGELSDGYVVLNPLSVGRSQSRLRAILHYRLQTALGDLELKRRYTVEIDDIAVIVALQSDGRSPEEQLEDVLAEAVLQLGRHDYTTGYDVFGLRSDQRLAVVNWRELAMTYGLTLSFPRLLERRPPAHDHDNLEEAIAATLNHLGLPTTVTVQQPDGEEGIRVTIQLPGLRDEPCERLYRAIRRLAIETAGHRLMVPGSTREVICAPASKRTT